ncbi:hypothetical protein GR212_15635 [Rhizobium lusitanum]|uniref:DUF5983 domain-containing protein n=1 Tax=Rhizobium lusitanum TaxID=293958 RepID=A0A6L9UA64_9HYPH|nr:hypothetical protein [Rhizobium lusitanum]NEI71010.1 hypothetical protein [Rhizobium lusitanum]
MTIQILLDISTAHLSPAAKAWLSEGATLNHAANYHGVGNGASSGTLGATMFGYFMRVSDIGVPADLLPIMEYASRLGIGFILFDADSEMLDELPLFLDGEHEGSDDDDGLITETVGKQDRDVFQPTKPMSFKYFEVRPCIETFTRLADQTEDGSADSYRTEEDYEAALAQVEAAGNRFKTFWTLYGIDAEGLAFAIGDFTTKKDAHEIMNAILAPIAAARDALDAGSRFTAHESDLLGRITTASDMLEDFINQSSNSERI